MKRFFASDNCASVHPKIMKALEQANEGHTISYGDDEYTKRAAEMIKGLFNKTCEVYFVINGTGANVTGLSLCLKSFNSVICAETAHINTDECGAFENTTGAKICPIESNDGKLYIEKVSALLHNIGVEHHSQPKVISITQSTEFGTLYTPEEIRKIADFAHENGMYLHMDGARIANAAAALDIPISGITCDVGVDILSFGGAKNGLMFGEAVVVFDRALAADFKYYRKQYMQLMSKMRYISAQYIALIEDGLYLENARHANKMAKLLGEELIKSGIDIVQPVEVNAVFAKLPKRIIEPLQKEMFFYVWNEDTNVVRLMTAFDTTEDDIKKFVELVKKYIN